MDNEEESWYQFNPWEHGNNEHGFTWEAGSSNTSSWNMYQQYTTPPHEQNQNDTSEQASWDRYTSTNTSGYNGGWNNVTANANTSWNFPSQNGNSIQPQYVSNINMLREEEEEDRRDLLFINTIVHDLKRYWMPRIRRNNGPQQGVDYMAYLFNGHPEGFKDALRMRKPIYVGLVNELVERGFLQYGTNARVGPYESFAIFIRTCAMNHHFRAFQDRFQHSNETIHRHFRKVLAALLQFAEIKIVPPNFNETHPRIANDPRFYPYFKDCIGALDGTHIPACVRKKWQLSWRNRKKELSQNVLAICDFDATFTYVCSSWEGSAHDTRILNYSRESDTRYPHPPAGKFYLVDSGYTNCSGYLSPFRNNKQQLPEWAPLTPSGPIELYNKRHAQLRNVIERAFGILKKRFPVFEHMPSYEVETQVDLVRACCAINNYILRTDPDDPYANSFVAPENTNHQCLETQTDVGRQPSQASIAAMGQFRDQLATQMWYDNN